MRHSISLALAFVMTTLLAPPSFAAGKDGDKPLDEATKLAVKLTEEGAATFDTLTAHFTTAGDVSLPGSAGGFVQSGAPLATARACMAGPSMMPSMPFSRANATTRRSE